VVIGKRIWRKCPAAVVVAMAAAAAAVIAAAAVAAAVIAAAVLVAAVIAAAVEHELCAAGLGFPKILPEKFL
jgi:hypothetical protein